MKDVIIMGGGAAGIAASIFASRYNLDNLVLSKEVGGLTLEAIKIENYPGFKSISGIELMDKFVDHAKNLGVEIIEEEVVDVKRIKSGFEIATKEGNKYQSKTIIIATGTERRKLNVPGEKEFAGKGVAYCATCDAWFFKDKVVAVVGGSDSATTSALHLSEFAKKVYIIYRRDELRGEPIWTERVKANPKIEVIYNTNVKEIKGDDFVNELILDNPHKGKKTLSVDGIFIEIGFIPRSDLAKRLGVKLSPEGNVEIDPFKGLTNVRGVYAAGDIITKPHPCKQIVNAAAEGLIAASSVYFHLKRGEEDDRD